MSTKKMERAAVAAAEVLDSLDAGKQRLPIEPELEEEQEQYEPEIEEQEDNEDHPEPSFTDEDKADFPILEKKWETGGRQEAEAVREIRQRKLWRLARNSEGEQLYADFDEYCEARWGHTRQWATHTTNWLTITEEMERLGIADPPHLSVRAAQGLLIDRLKEAGGLRAVLEEAKQDGVAFDRDHLREVVLRRADYSHRSEHGTEGINKPAAPNYAEYKKDLAAVKRLGAAGSTSLFEQAVEATRCQSKFGTGLADSLVTLAQRQRKMPDRDCLLANFTGTALEELVERLLEVANDIKDVETKKEELAARRQQIKSLLQDGGIQKLKDEAKSLEDELASVGAIKKRRGKNTLEFPQVDDGRGIPSSELVEDEATESEQTDSEVYTALHSVQQDLADVLELEWPGEESDLNAILLTTQECEQKLAEIVAKAKELLAESHPAVISISE